MKIKPLYIYLFGIVLAGAVFFYVSQGSGTTNLPTQSEIANKQIPNDAVHRGLQNPNNQSPNKSNVDSTVMKHLDMLKKAVEASPNDTVKLKQYADFLAAAHEPGEALEYYNRILKVNPNRTDIIFSVAYINYTEKKFDEAEKLLKRVLSYDKNNLRAYYNLGAIAYSSGNKEKAKKIWTKLADDYPNSPMGKMAKESVKHI